MDKENLYFILRGISVVFILHVLYNELVRYPAITHEFFYGVIVGIVLFMITFLYGRIVVYSPNRN